LLSQEVSRRLKYATVGVLFVNISIGGTLTPFAAPPVLMVAAKWNWDIWFMLANFGWKAAIAVVVNAAVAMLFSVVSWRTWARSPVGRAPGCRCRSWPCIWLFLVGVVVFAHHIRVVFMGLFLFFLGFTAAYQRHQSPLILREGLLVAFFLAGLVVLGGLQQWWLQPVLLAWMPTPCSLAPPRSRPSPTTLR
jgi:hypothetical protein